MAAGLQSQTLVYKTIDNVDIPLDVLVPRDAKAVPVLLWFHGGGLLQGRRDGMAPHLRQSVDIYNHAVISADYRLAPQANISDICADVLDCIAFIRSPHGLAKHLEAGIVDTTRLAVSGSSAGGYLAFLAGLYSEPKPNVIMPIYPITDPLGYFFTNPQPFPLFKPPGSVNKSKRVTKDDVAEFVDRKAAQVPNCSRDSSRSNIYYYMLDQGNLAELLGFKPGQNAYNDPENDRWRIAKAISQRALPPTYVVHGDLDRAVGVEQADEVVGVMIGLGLPVQYERLKGADHLFDTDPEYKLESMYEFMHRHLRGGKL